ncbi:hypothetical protein F3J27_06300 [Enterobacter sp. Ap-916]|nr:hypothetical protein [Enterobacter sp. Ap-867]NIG29090.1 hypothetical protein [Enterobacter sp. Ap-916]
MEIMLSGREAAYAMAYSMLHWLISLPHIDMLFPYFRIFPERVCWTGIPKFRQLRTSHEQNL